MQITQRSLQRMHIIDSRNPNCDCAGFRCEWRKQDFASTNKWESIQELWQSAWNEERNQQLNSIDGCSHCIQNPNQPKAKISARQNIFQLKMSENKKASEVSHSDATELFLAIEEMEWRDAFDIIRLDPNQARTWVNSSGSGTITSWRRLPIHEVRSIERCFPRATTTALLCTNTI